MYINISEKHHCKQAFLAFDCLIPEEAFTLMNCLFQDDMCDILQWYEISLEYGVTGYTDLEKSKWGRDLVLFIEPSIAENDEQIQEDIEDLTKLKDLILKKTGLMDH